MQFEGVLRGLKFPQILQKSTFVSTSQRVNEKHRLAFGQSLIEISHVCILHAARTAGQCCWHAANQ